LVFTQLIGGRRARTKRWISSSIPESQWDTDAGLYLTADYHVNNFVSPVLFKEALDHVPSNAIVVEIAPHGLLQGVLRRALDCSCTIVGLMDRRQPDNLAHLLTSLDKYVRCVFIGYRSLFRSVVNKDLSFKAKDYRTCSRIALDYGVRENIKLRKSNLTVAQVHAINTLLNSVKGSKLSAAFMS